MTAPSLDQCTLNLYYRDTRIANNHCGNKTVMTMTEQTAARTREAICEFFKVTQENDSRLFRSILSSDVQFNGYELIRIDAPGVIETIEVSGDRRVPFVDKPESFLAVERGACKIHVMITSVFGGNDYDIRFNELRGSRKEDLAMVSLYNSQSYTKVNQISTNMGLIRTLEII